MRWRTPRRRLPEGHVDADVDTDDTPVAETTPPRPRAEDDVEMEAFWVEHEQIEHGVGEGEEYPHPEIPKHQRSHGDPMIIPCQGRVEQVHVDQEEAEVELDEASRRLLASWHSEKEE